MDTNEAIENTAYDLAGKIGLAAEQACREENAIKVWQLINLMHRVEKVWREYKRIVG